MKGIGRSPCGERGLKWDYSMKVSAQMSRSPCGERGLKYGKAVVYEYDDGVAPRAGSVD